MKDLLGLKALSKDEILDILNLTSKMRGVVESGAKKTADLSGKSVMLCFYEPSTRTSSSFDHAVKILGGNSINLSVKNSSVNKGETLLDTAKALENLGADAIVIRHSMGGAPHFLAKNLKTCVINAGDGFNEHPTQGLLDIFTMRRRFGELKGLKVFIAGDIKHSRVVRSNIYGLQKLGASVTVYGPPTLMPAGIENLARVAKNMEDGCAGADVVMGLRLQLERQSTGMVPSVAEYSKYYGINERLLKLASKNAVIMHPGPVNRGAEIDTAAADCAQSAINEQVLNGLCVRMAALKILAGGEK